MEFPVIFPKPWERCCRSAACSAIYSYERTPVRDQSLYERAPARDCLIRTVVLFLVVLPAILLVLPAGLSAQSIQLTPEQQQILNSLPPAQRAQAEAAMRQVQGRAGAPQQETDAKLEWEAVKPFRAHTKKNTPQRKTTQKQLTNNKRKPDAAFPSALPSHTHTHARTHTNNIFLRKARRCNSAH